MTTIQARFYQLLHHAVQTGAADELTEISPAAFCRWCDQHGIPHAPEQDLHDALQKLAQGLVAKRPRTATKTTRASSKRPRT